jgi:ankyrin repeat protein
MTRSGITLLILCSVALILNLYGRFSGESDRVARERRDIQMLCDATRAGDTNAVSQILDSGVSPDVKSSSGRVRPIHIAARCLDPDMALFLISRGADPNARGAKDDCTALAIAAALGKPLALRFCAALLDAGADVNAPDTFGRTPLMYAALNGNLDIVTLLIDNGADIDLQYRHRTARDMALNRNHMNVVRFIDDRTEQSPNNLLNLTNDSRAAADI